MKRIWRERTAWAPLILIGGLLAFVSVAARSPAADDVAQSPPAPSTAPARPTPLAPPAATDDSAHSANQDEQPAASEPAKPAPEAGKIGIAAQLEFQQAKVSAEMTELEQRMFRLAETLKPLEPENSSRLMLGVKFAREELILHQMQEVRNQLRAASLAESVIEQKQLLAKLERLEQLLLSPDLDFQMRLERLRQIREVLRRLDTLIREEDRERKLSGQSAQNAQRLADAEARALAVQQLIERQTAHLSQLQALLKDEPKPDPEKKESPDGLRPKLKTEQAKTRDQAAALIPPLVASSPAIDAPSPSIDALVEANGHMAGAAEKLGGQQPADAQAPMQSALKSLQKAQAESHAEADKLRALLKAERFAAMSKDQSDNRRSTEAVSEMVRGLGNNGAQSLGELIKAGGSMSRAETDLTGLQPAPAGEQQDQALASLKFAREQLAEEARQLQDQLRGEVKRRTLEGLALMLEQQIVIREGTETLAKSIAGGSRHAQAAVLGLSKAESKIIALADELITLVEETEFAIALPAALRVVRDEMQGVQTSLSKSEANAEVVAAEKQIEADLAGLLEAMKQMPAAGKRSGGRNPNDSQQQERELNRLVAELKLIRLLETRVHQETVGVDGARVGGARVDGGRADSAPPDSGSGDGESGDSTTILPALRKQIEALTGRQEHVRDVLEQLSEQRNLQ